MRLISIFALALIAPAALAQTMPAPPVPSAPPKPVVRTLSADEADYMQREAVLVRQLRLMDLQAQIADAARKIAGNDGKVAADAAGLPALPPLPPPAILRAGSSAPAMPATGAQADAPKLPKVAAAPQFQVVSIWGTEGNYAADLMSNGLRVPVRKGDRLPSGWVVVEVLRTGVVIASGSKRQTLLIGG